MPERPLLVLKSPTQIEREKKSRPFPQPRVPGLPRQVARFTPKFDRLQNILARDNAQLELKGEATGLAPDRAIVFEVVGSLSDFASQSQRLGFSFLGEFESEFDPDEDFYIEGKGGKKLSSTLYLVMPDLRAMQEMLSMWTRFKEGREFEVGTGQWRKLFEQLKDVRPWGPEDRVTDGFQDKLSIWAQSTSEAPFRFEVDLWYTDSTDKRSAAKAVVQEVMTELGGQLLSEANIEPIRYHGLLAEIPKASMEQIISEDNPLVMLDQIMYLNPRAMTVCEPAEALGEIDSTQANITQQPIAALLDGFPLANHERLVGRISIDDFLDIEQFCPAASRHHGTAMASLIHHGDMHDAAEPDLKSSLLVLPVLQADLDENIERMPQNRLAIDVIYQAVRRIKEGDGDTPASGPNVVVINHSLADANGPYTNKKISPWGRLLDYLSFQHKVLFIVSAGNHANIINLTECPTIKSFEDATQEDQVEFYQKALAEDMRNRQVLAPAEALNPLTVGAWHADECVSQARPAAFVDILPGQDGPSPITAVGLGHRRSVKPDLFYDGGRTLARIIANGDCCALQPIVQSTPFSGQKVASPSSGGELNRITNMCGTSNSAALVTRKAIQLHEMLDELAAESPEANVPLSHKAVLLKALLAHGCDWHKRGTALDKIIEPQDVHSWEARRTNVARLIGLGRPNISRVLECTKQRATMFGWGTIELDKSQTFTVPLPSSLSGRREARRMTVTLAWLSPVNPRHQQYRQAVLEMDLNPMQCGVKRKNILQPPENTIKRGTLIQSQYKGSKEVEFNGDFALTIKCRMQAGSLDDPIPYALVVSLEVGDGSNIDVYNEVVTKLAIEDRQPVVIG